MSYIYPHCYPLNKTHVLSILIIHFVSHPCSFVHCRIERLKEHFGGSHHGSFSVSRSVVRTGTSSIESHVSSESSSALGPVPKLNLPEDGNGDGSASAGAGDSAHYTPVAGDAEDEHLAEAIRSAGGLASGAKLTRVSAKQYTAGPDSTAFGVRLVGKKVCHISKSTRMRTSVLINTN